MIIPLDGMKSSRGFELLGKTAVAMAARDNLTNSSNDDTQSSNVLSDKLDSVISLLSQLVSGQANPTPAYVIASQAQTELSKLKTTNSRTSILARG